MISQIPLKVSYGYTPITKEIKQMVQDLVTDGGSLSGLAHDLNIGYRARATVIKKILGTTVNPYKTIRIDIVEKIEALHKNVQVKNK